MFRVQYLIFLAFVLIDVSIAHAQVRFYVGKHKCDARTSAEKALLKAVNDGRESLVWELLKKEATADMTDDCGIQILTYATATAGPAIMKLLIDAGADVNAADRSIHRLPLFHAINSLDREGRFAVVKVLIEAGVNLDVTDSGETVLMKAVLKEDIRLVELLISAGAKVNYHDGGRTAYSCAAVLGNQKLKDILLEAGADPAIGVPKYEKEWGEHAFFQAAADGRSDVVEAMLTSGKATVNITNAHKVTALMRAHDDSVVDVLLKAGADVNMRDDRGFTALMWALELGRSSIVKKLIEAGADVNARTNEGKSALDLADNYEIERLLKDAGANSKKSLW